jgi:hypothetical protein
MGVTISAGGIWLAELADSYVFICYSPIKASMKLFFHSTWRISDGADIRVRVAALPLTTLGFLSFTADRTATFTEERFGLDRRCPDEYGSTRVYMGEAAMLIELIVSHSSSISSFIGVATQSQMRNLFVTFTQTYLHLFVGFG